MSDADFAHLGDMEFSTIPELYEFAQYGRNVSSASGLIIMQAGADFKRACLTIPVVNGRPNLKANRASRPLRRAAMHLHAVQRCFAVLPKVFLSVYSDEISVVRQRNSGRRGIDLAQ